MEQFLAYGLCKGMIFAISAAGFYLIYTTTRAFHLAHAVVCASATYFAYSCFSRFHFSPLALVLAAAFGAAVVGVAIDLLVYRPLQRRKASALVLLISSLGTNVALTNVLLLIFSSKPVVFHSGAEPTTHFASIIFNQSQTRQLLVLIPLAVAYLILMKVGSFGRLCAALADNSQLATVLGVNVNNARTLIFIIGSSMAGIGSVLLALDVGTEPHFGMSLMLSSVAACIIGGLRWHAGPIVGGIVLGLLQGLVAWAFASEWEMAATYVLVITIILLRRQGVLSISRRPEEV